MCVCVCGGGGGEGGWLSGEDDEYASVNCSMTGPQMLDSPQTPTPRYICIICITKTGAVIVQLLPGSWMHVKGAYDARGVSSPLPKSLLP